DNCSKLREGAIPHGFGGGIARVCANEKADQWEDGFRYLISTSGATSTVVYCENINNDDPGSNDDEDFSFAVGSRFKNLVSGIEYICTDASNNNAVWEPLSGNVTVIAGGDLTIEDLFTIFQWNGNICNFSITGNLTTPDGASAGYFLSLEFPFEYLNDFVSENDAIMTVDIKLSDTNIGLLKWAGSAQNTTKAIRVDFEVDITATSEVARMSIVGQFINNPA
ncbi:MAG: hypothetical protein NT153_03095, partial [Bacteroidetes bacterium]|nr:hypothetical protein [Bacteroidota bacterium]